jgi:hypothetical protein
MADSGTYTPETLARHYKIAQSLMEDPKTPYTHWAQPLAEITKKGIGGYIQGRTEEDEKAQRADATKQIAALFSDSAQSSAPVGAAPAGDPASAIAGIESGGKYDAIGPITNRGDRAYGKYQVMGNNILEWTKKHLGQPMSPEEFLANPQAQDAVFKGQFGQYSNKYGPVGAAKAWFAGEGGMNNPNAKDILGTTVQSYGDKFAKALGFNGQPQSATASMPPQMQGGDNQPSPLDTAQYPAGPVGAPSQSPQGGVPAVAQALQAPGGQPPAGPAGLANNPNSAKIAAILTNPWIDPSVKQAVIGQMSPSYGFQTLPDGTIIRTNPKTGQVEPIYSAPVKPELKETGSDPITGQKSYQVFDPKTQTMRPVAGPDGQPQGGQQSGFLAPGVKAVDRSLSGDDYLKQYGPEVQAAVKAYINGDVLPSGNPRMQSLANTAKTIAQKYGADMGIPVSDATYSQRRTYRSQLGSNSPSSSGGQAKAFNQGIEHMGHLADTLENLDNSNGLGIPAIASAVNSVRQGVSTDQAAIADKASSIGQTLAGEVGKLFSGSSGGGVHERELTRERFSTVKSKPQLAAALEGTLEMMRGGLTALEQRRDEVMGPNSGIRFVNPETEAKIAKIQETIDRLKGNSSAPKAGGDPVEAEMRKRGLLK